mgnify:CR=1 FL=1
MFDVTALRKANTMDALTLQLIDLVANTEAREIVIERLGDAHAAALHEVALGTELLEQSFSSTATTQGEKKVRACERARAHKHAYQSIRPLIPTLSRRAGNTSSTD